MAPSWHNLNPKNVYLAVSYILLYNHFQKPTSLTCLSFLPLVCFSLLSVFFPSATLSAFFVGSTNTWGDHPIMCGNNWFSCGCKVFMWSRVHQSRMSVSILVDVCADYLLPKTVLKHTLFLKGSWEYNAKELMMLPLISAVFLFYFFW